MKLLILGGTRFVGRALVQRALTEGHDLTLFHRSPTELFPEARHILGDRNEGHGALAGETYDAVIDVSAYVPRVAADAARSVQTDRCVFVSTISVYDDPPAKGDESAKLLPSVRDTEEVSGETYGGLKVACEEEVLAARPNAAIVRPGLIGGAYDPTNRLPYYVRRFRQGGRMLVPGRFEQSFQIIDARDLAGLMLHLAASGTGGIFNAVGPEVRLGDLWAIGREIEPSVEPVPVRDLEAHGLKPGVDLPLALSDDGSDDGFMQLSALKAEANGLVRRSFRETVMDTDAWLQREDPGVAGAKYGALTLEKEAEILTRLG